MRKILLLLFLGVLNATVSRAQSKPDLPDYPFKLGEKLVYSMHYGWFEIGDAEVYIDESLWELNGRSHFYIQCKLRTIGFFSFFSNLEVCMDSWVDTQTLRPTKSSRDVVFGSRIDIRTDRFDYRDSVRVSAYVEDVNSKRFHAFVRNDTLLFDALSTYLYLRSLDLQSAGTSQTYPVSTFFSNDLYRFGMTFSESLDFDFKNLKWPARRFDLLFPETEQFSSDKQAYVVASADGDNLPLKFVMEMRYGDFSFELIERSR